MKMLALLLLLAAAPARAAYFEPCLKRSAGFLIAPRDLSDSAGTVDLALICHQGDPDSSLVPRAWQGVIAPETWAFQTSLGGDFNGNAIIAPGVSANVAPMLATSFLHYADAAQPTVAGKVKAWLLGNGTTQFRLGGGLYPHWIEQGHFQSFRAMLPGQGFFDILGGLARVNVGLAW